MSLNIECQAHQEDSLFPMEAIWSLLKLEHFSNVPQSPLKPKELLFFVNPSVFHVMSVAIWFMAISASAERLSRENSPANSASSPLLQERQQLVARGYEIVLKTHKGPLL